MDRPFSTSAFDNPHLLVVQGCSFLVLSRSQERLHLHLQDDLCGQDQASGGGYEGRECTGWFEGCKSECGSKRGGGWSSARLRSKEAT